MKSFKILKLFNLHNLDFMRLCLDRDSEQVYKNLMN